jgi:hypothetical protein
MDTTRTPFATIPQLMPNSANSPIFHADRYVRSPKVSPRKKRGQQVWQTSAVVDNYVSVRSNKNHLTVIRIGDMSERRRGRYDVHRQLL